MISFLETLLPPKITVLDLAAGAGSISQRLLRRCPETRSVAVDMDPVMLALGERAWGDTEGRLRWVRADLRDPEWATTLGEDGFDAVVSATAAHGLRPDELTAVYRNVAGLLRDGGVLLNFDRMHHPRFQTQIRAAGETIDQRRQKRAVAGGAEAWADWWDALRAEPALQDAFAQRDRLLSSRHRLPGNPPTLAFHEVALLEAGFTEVGTVWQDLHRRILLAFR